MGDNISYGRKPDGSPQLGGFDEGTPGTSNISEFLIEGPNSRRLETPFFSHEGGFYTESFSLTLSTGETNATIYYTLDGSVPTTESEQYTEPIQIKSKHNGATVVRARLYKEGYPRSGKAKNFINDHPINQFSRILLRTSGTDSEKSLFRDAFMQSLIPSSVPLDRQSAKPSIVYINGEYYGIHNIREDYEKGYIHNHYDMDEEDVVMIKNPTGVAGVDIKEGYVGDEMHYNQMIEYVQEHDLKSEKAYMLL